jgi:hypothetical protein
VSTWPELLPASAGTSSPVVDPLRVVVAAYLARYKGITRTHTESDLRIFLARCVGRHLDPLLGDRRPHPRRGGHTRLGFLSSRVDPQLRVGDSISHPGHAR